MYPTSNHNVISIIQSFEMLYIFCILHQTTTWSPLPRWMMRCISFVSYIKPQRCHKLPQNCHSCISFVSYIKPQPIRIKRDNLFVVYLLYPTSNHNLLRSWILVLSVVYLLYPTSNHNLSGFINMLWGVVYLLYPTSNHNL